MPVKDIIQEVKNLNSRQVLVFVLIGSLYLNYYQIQENKIEINSNKAEIKLITKAKDDAIEYERKRTDKANLENLKNTKESTEKAYQQERRIDSLFFEIKLKK